MKNRIKKSATSKNSISNIRIKPLVIATLAAVMIAGPGLALAKDRSHGGHHDSGHHSYSHDRHGSRHSGHRRLYGSHSGYGRHSKHRSYYSSYYDNDDLLIGLIVGGLIGYVISDSQSNNNYYEQSYPRSHTHRTPVPAVEYEYQEQSSNTCLMEREYQTTVTVGGREVDAYGTACLQSDGSWNRGTAKLVSF